jgi:hypothetical protein
MGRLLGVAALDDDVAGLLQAERAGGPGGRDLAGAVADGGGGMNAVGAQRADAGDLDREQQRLRHVGVAQRPLQLGIVQPGCHRPAEFARQQGVDLGQGGAKRRAQGQRVARHPGPLAAVSRKDERERPGDRLADRHARLAPGVEPAIEPSRQLRVGPGQHRHPVRMVFASSRRTPQHRGRDGAGGEPVAPVRRHCAQRLRGASR